MFASVFWNHNASLIKENSFSLEFLHDLVLAASHHFKIAFVWEIRDWRKRKIGELLCPGLGILFPAPPALHKGLAPSVLGVGLP